MNPDIWGVFHDGSIDALSRPAPGVVQAGVSILYPREMFNGAGGGFLVTLQGCSLFRYRPFEGDSLEDLREIVLAEPEILSVDRRPHLVLLCTAGELDLVYDTMAVSLDTGEAAEDTGLEEAPAGCEGCATGASAPALPATTSVLTAMLPLWWRSRRRSAATRSL